MKANINILLIDDDPKVLDNFSEVLVKEGYQVIKTHNWHDASEYLKLHKFNIVITDVCLQDISYKAMIEAIKQSNKYSFIITTSGFSDIELAMESVKLGAEDYITKPFNPSDFVISMRRLVEKQHVQSETTQLFDTIKVLAMALDARDAYTQGHCEQVTEYSVWMAHELGLSKIEIDNIHEAGLLHDIGKIGIPDAVLLKPGRLTKEEYEIIKQHPQIGKKILDPVDRLADVVPLIYYHHERFDGHGYPVGLKGKDIPLGARILAVADSYQAMTSDRPYRKALDQKIAIRELEINRNKQFDTEVVDVFIKVLVKKGLLSRQEK
ncbi:MAG: response regulator [Candidatus Omnitrophica bacterium]|nr:response regulator [Candidatus Omnitrophota bacterium]